MSKPLPGMNTAEPKERTDRYHYIDGLRGIAVAMVLLFHSAIWAGLNSPLRPLYDLGRPGVDLFLVLSGFCLFWPMVDKTTGEVRPLNIKRYAVRRARRIAPPFYAAIACFLLAAFFVSRFGGPSWWNQPFQEVFPLRPLHFIADLATHVLLIYGLFNSYIHSFDGAFWSLSLEAQFYVLLPILVWIARRYSVRWALAVPLVITLGFRLVLRKVDPVFLASYVGDEVSLSRWAEFGCGMAAAYGAATAARRALPRTFLRAALVVVVGIALAAEHFHPTSLAMPFIWGVSGGLLVVYPALFDGKMRAALSQRWLVFLGTISYSVYLIHGTVFELIAIPLSRSGNVHARHMVYLIAAPLAAVFCAYFFHLAFERPFMSSPSPKSERQAEVVAAVSPAP